MENTRVLDRPIFIVGHARGGSTALATIVNWHSHVGPKHCPAMQCENIATALERTRHTDSHLDYSIEIEQKRIWFDHFPGEKVFTHMGNELIAEHCLLEPSDRARLIKRLTTNFREMRFLSKAPTNSFRVRVIRELFPNAKIVALYRRGEEVVASWGARSYGFGQKVSWGKTQFDALPYREGIDIFARKWRQTLDYLESVREELGIHAMTYDQLVSNTVESLERLFEYLELPWEDYLGDIRLAGSKSKWKEMIPLRYRFQLMRRTLGGNALLRAIEKEIRPGRRAA